MFSSTIGITSNPFPTPKNEKSLEKKMKDYLKDGSKGKFDMNPDIFPIGNGELAKMDIRRGTTPTVRMAMGGLTNVGPRYNMGIMGLNR